MLLIIDIFKLGYEHIIFYWYLFFSFLYIIIFMIFINNLIFCNIFVWNVVILRLIFNLLIEIFLVIKYKRLNYYFIFFLFSKNHNFKIGFILLI